ncbi:MAG: glycosyltransferase family 2 protein [Bacillota bacterium]
MIAAVIPAQNESSTIGQVISNLSGISVDLVVPVINGSTDGTLNAVKKAKKIPRQIIHFSEPLGIDVPRAVGAAYAFLQGADVVLFLDGDMCGAIQTNLLNLIEAVQNGVDMALTNCYPYITMRQSLATRVLEFRSILNKELGLFQSLGLASPAHGPHAVSREFLRVIPFKELGIPPAGMALAKIQGLNIQVATAVPHIHLGSSVKDVQHARMIAQTIIGDCLEAISLYHQRPRTRVWQGQEYQGYNPQRRWDTLDCLLAGDIPFPVHTGK